MLARYNYIYNIIVFFLLKLLFFFTFFHFKSKKGEGIYEITIKFLQMFIIHCIPCIRNHQHLYVHCISLTQSNLFTEIKYNYKKSYINIIILLNWSLISFPFTYMNMESSEVDWSSLSFTTCQNSQNLVISLTKNLKNNKNMIIFRL